MYIKVKVNQVHTSLLENTDTLNLFELDDFVFNFLSRSNICFRLIHYGILKASFKAITLLLLPCHTQFCFIKHPCHTQILFSGTFSLWSTKSIIQGKHFAPASKTSFAFRRQLGGRKKL